MRAYLKQPWAIIAVLAWFLGTLLVGDILDQFYWNTRFRSSRAPVDSAFVLVRVDDTASVWGKPWSTDEDIRLLDVVSSGRPGRIFFDPRSDGALDPQLLQKIQSLGDKLTYVVRSTVFTTEREVSFRVPEALADRTPIVASGWQTNIWMYAAQSPYAFQRGERIYPAFSAALAGVSGASKDQFSPDFRVYPRSVITISATDLLEGKKAATALAGKSVVVSHLRETPDQMLGYFGSRAVDPVYVDIAAASALHHGRSRPWSGYPLLILFIGMIAGARLLKGRRLRAAAYAAVGITMLGVPVLAQTYGPKMSIREAYIAAAIYFAMRLWSKWRRKVRETSQSGLPNFVAMAQEKGLAESDVVVGVIARYEEFLASIPGDLHGECARQIARRFAVGCGARTIYHGEGGFFAWTEPARPVDQQLEHLEGMRALFAAPLLVGGHMFDTNVHFGLDRNHKLDAQSRVNTALASASEALRDGRPVELFQADRLANAAWELSLLARIDEGMRNGDIWLAYQPQWDYREARISGAEALIRWNDPVRGPIRPDEFILQAERAGRIDALTYWVLEQAIGAAEEFNLVGPRFQTSINLSAQLVDKPGLVSSVAEIVRRRGVDCSLLTVEVTETASLHDRPAAIRNLRALQQLGFRLSIDDFGTGEASLLYLAELPSDELKIDRQFVSRIVHHERERHIVRSTVQLAHALGQTVVAEGIEDLATFDLLRKLGCDAGQGYYIGRPETFAQLRSRYTIKGGGLRGTA